MPEPDFRRIFLGLPSPPSVDSVEELRKAVDEATGHARNATFLLVTVCLYVAILGGATSHRMLLMGEAIQIPLLNIPVQIVWAYAVAPIMVLAIHGWLMVSLVLLARRMDAFDTGAKLLGGEEERRQRGLVTAFPLVEWRVGNRHGQIEHYVRGVLFWSIYVAFPVLALLWIELRFLPYQHEWLTPLQLTCIVADLMLIWTTWPTVDGPSRSIQLRVIGGWASFTTVALAGFLLVDQYTENRWSRLEVTDQILFRRSPPPEILAQARMKARPGREDEAETAVFLDPELTEPVNLKERKLRRANLSRSRLPGAILEGANLADASLYGVDLQNAHFYGAVLRGAQLTSSGGKPANLSGITICRPQYSGRNTDKECAAQLQGARLDQAQLTDAELDQAQLQGAPLDAAQLQGASLLAAKLQGATLFGADLRGANLNAAELHGAILSAANIQGASLVRANLQSANLDKAGLQGANLEQAQLQAASFYLARLQGARLVGADLWGSSLQEANLSLASVRDVRTAPPDAKLINDLLNMVEALPEPRLRETVRTRLAPFFAERLQVWVPERLPESLRKDMFFSGMKRPSLEAEIFFDPGIVRRDYIRKLAEHLASIACDSIYVLRGQVRMYYFLPVYPLLAKGLLDPECKAASLLLDRERERLKYFAGFRQ